MALAKGTVTNNPSIAITTVDPRSATLQHNTASGSNRLLLGGIAYQNTLTVNSATYNNDSMTLIGTWGTNVDGAGVSYTFFYILDPDTGNNDFKVNFANGNSGTVNMMCTSFTGAGGIGNSAHNNGASSPNSQTLSVSAGSMIFCFGASRFSMNASEAVKIDGVATSEANCDFRGAAWLAQIAGETRNATLTAGSKTCITRTVSDAYNLSNLRIEIQESASATVPTVTTTAISNITRKTADSGGNVTSDGGAAVTARGVCWNTTGSPTTADSTTSNGTGTGSYTSNLTGLDTSQQYFVRAYATNSEGTAYGSQLDFRTKRLFMIT